MTDLINHPPHYKRGGYECLDVIEALGLSYHLGNALKYLWRAGVKDPAKEMEDLRKARFFLDREIALREKEHTISAPSDLNLPPKPQFIPSCGLLECKLCGPESAQEPRTATVTTLRP